MVGVDQHGAGSSAICSDATIMAVSMLSKPAHGMASFTSTLEAIASPRLVRLLADSKVHYTAATKVFVEKVCLKCSFLRFCIIR